MRSALPRCRCRGPHVGEPGPFSFLHLMNNLTHQSLRPSEVTLAAALLSLSVALGAINMVGDAHLNNPFNYVVLADILGFSALIIWCILRGQIGHVGHSLLFLRFASCCPRGPSGNCRIAPILILSFAARRCCCNRVQPSLCACDRRRSGLEAHMPE